MVYDFQLKFHWNRCWTSTISLWSNARVVAIVKFEKTTLIDRVISTTAACTVWSCRIEYNNLFIVVCNKWILSRWSSGCRVLSWASGNATSSEFSCYLSVISRLNRWFSQMIQIFCWKNWKVNSCKMNSFL